MKYALCALLMASTLFAAKTPTVFGPGVEGFLKTKSPQAVAYNVVTNGEDVVFVSFTGLDAKSQLQLTTCTGNIMVNDIKQIKQKGKIFGYADSIIIGSLIAPAGNASTMIKLKGVSIGTVFAYDLKMVHCDDLKKLWTTRSTESKGIIIKAEGNIGGKSLYLDNGWIIGVIKKMTAKGSIEYLDMVSAIPAKKGKTKINAKVPGTGGILVRPGQWSIKSKNVNFVPVDLQE